MASKKDYSATNDTTELTDLIAAFEGHNKCKIILSSSIELRRGFLDWKWTAKAVSGVSEGPVAYRLVLESAMEWAGDYKTVLALVTRLLYALDFKLAEKEFGSVETKKR